MADVGLSQDYRDLLVCLADSGAEYRMGVRPNVIELLTQIDGMTFDEASAGHRTFEVDGRRIPFIARAALLANKRASGRAKDLADVEWLESHDEE